MHYGQISVNETWLASENDHIITANITVVDSVTLTIEAGAVVKFAGNFQILVIGNLVAQGSDELDFEKS
jgi:hypothetical protein